MRRLTRKTLYTQNVSDDVRLNQLERRIPQDYPIWNSQLLKNTGNLTGPVDHPFDFTFPDDCPDPSGLACEDRFVTSGQWMLFPTGWGGAPYWVSMVVKMGGGGGNIHNVYTVVTPGTLGETDEVSLWIEMEVWRNNAPFGTVSGYGFVTASQTPPKLISTQLTDRSWSILTLMPGHGILDPGTDRFAARFHIQVNTGAGPTQFDGQAVVGLMPPNSGTVGAFGL